MTNALINRSVESGTLKNGHVITAEFGGFNKEFRLSYTRRFSIGPILQILMFNPSNGDAYNTDKTLTDSCTIARKNGYGAIHVINLYTVIEQTASKVPLIADKGVVPIKEVIHKDAETTLVAFGDLKSGNITQYSHMLKTLDALSLITKLVCLGTSKSGLPRHIQNSHINNPDAVLKEFIYED